MPFVVLTHWWNSTGDVPTCSDQQRTMQLWKHDCEGCVSQRRGVAYRYPSGCMTCGSRVTIWNSHTSFSLAISTRRPSKPCLVLRCFEQPCQESKPWHTLAHLQFPAPCRSCCSRSNHRLSLQDRFIQYKTKTMTKSETNANVIANGWYTKDDMVKILKWPVFPACNHFQLVVFTSIAWYQCIHLDDDWIVIVDGFMQLLF